MIVREASILDHTGIVLSILSQLEERIVSVPPASKHIATWVSDTLVNGFVVVAEEEGKIVGTIGMRLGHFPWNNDVHILNHEWLHVHKDYRKGDIATQLIEQVKQFCNQRQMLARFDVITDQAPEAKDRFFRMRGLRFMGGNYLYGLGER